MYKLMQVSSFLFILLCPFSFVQAEMRGCLSTLTDNWSVNSKVFRLHTDRYPSKDFGRDYLAWGTFWTRSALNDAGCSKRDVDFSDGPMGKAHSECAMLVEDHQESKMCYIETNLGSFNVLENSMGEITVIFNRWD